MREFKKMRKQKKTSYACTRYILIAYLVGFSAFIGFKYYSAGSIELRAAKVDVYIPSEANFDDVVLLLKDKKVFTDETKFKQYSKVLGYTKVKGGRYVVKRGIGYRELIRMLAAGQQTPVNLVISGNVRLKDKLAGIISRQVEADSVSILNLLNDKTFLADLGFTPDNSILLFLPNTYNVYWNRAPKSLLEDMKKQYDKFWNPKRLEQLKATGLTKDEVMIIASIAIEESSKGDELPRIVGVYINRLKKNMPLQADPTVKYAVGDFTLKRVLTKHTEYESPYNTYKNTGLPPGPICIPSIVAIDAVLNYEQHDYFYFCAKDDFSGYHVFAQTLQQHNQNAQAYRNALNRKKIY